MTELGVIDWIQVVKSATDWIEKGNVAYEILLLIIGGCFAFFQSLEKKREKGRAEKKDKHQNHFSLRFNLALKMKRKY